MLVTNTTGLLNERTRTSRSNKLEETTAIIYVPSTMYSPLRCWNYKNQQPYISVFSVPNLLKTNPHLFFILQMINDSTFKLSQNDSNILELISPFLDIHGVKSKFASKRWRTSSSADTLKSGSRSNFVKCSELYLPVWSSKQVKAPAPLPHPTWIVG